MLVKNLAHTHIAHTHSHTCICHHVGTHFRPSFIWLAPEQDGVAYYIAAWYSKYRNHLQLYSIIPSKQFQQALNQTSVRRIVLLLNLVQKINYSEFVEKQNTPIILKNHLYFLSISCNLMHRMHWD